MISPCTLISRGFSVWWGYLVKPLVILCDVLPRWDPHSGFTGMRTERHKAMGQSYCFEARTTTKGEKSVFPQSFCLFSFLYISVFPAKEFPADWGKKIGASSEEKK